MKFDKSLKRLILFVFLFTVNFANASDNIVAIEAEALTIPTEISADNILTESSNPDVADFKEAPGWHSIILRFKDDEKSLRFCMNELKLQFEGEEMIINSAGNELRFNVSDIAGWEHSRLILPVEELPGFGGPDDDVIVGVKDVESDETEMKIIGGQIYLSNLEKEKDVMVSLPDGVNVRHYRADSLGCVVIDTSSSGYSGKLLIIKAGRASFKAIIK